MNDKIATASLTTLAGAIGSRHFVHRFRTHSGRPGHELQGGCGSGTGQSGGRVHRAFRCIEGPRLQAGRPQGGEMCGANPLRAVPLLRFTTASTRPMDARRFSFERRHSRANSRQTCTGCHRPRPVGVGMLRAFSAAAMPCRVVTPLACMSAPPTRRRALFWPCGRGRWVSVGDGGRL
jgi:hypothetical protein